MKEAGQLDGVEGAGMYAAGKGVAGPALQFPLRARQLVPALVA